MGKMRQNGFRGLAVVLGVALLFTGMPVGGFAAIQLEELVVGDNWDKVDTVLPDGTNDMFAEDMCDLQAQETFDEKDNSGSADWEALNKDRDTSPQEPLDGDDDTSAATETEELESALTRDDTQQDGREAGVTYKAEPNIAAEERTAETVVDTYEALLEAVQNTADGGAIQIAADITLPEPLELDKSLSFEAAQGAGEVTLTSSSYRHILYTGGESYFTTRGVVLEGGGKAGGIHSEAEHLILDAVIRNCAATDEYGKSSAGGGIYLDTGKNLTIVGGEISANTADLGGGVFASDSTVTISDGKIHNNSAQNGGGIWGGGNTITVTGGEIYNNTANSGGGICVYTYAEIIMNGGMVSNNTAAYGGGIYGANSTLSMAGGEIFGNIATSGGGGVLMSAARSGVTMTGGDITENTAPLGGGICIEGNGGFLVLTGGRVCENRAEYGGGMYAIGNCAISITDAVVSENHASEDGGGIWCGRNREVVDLSLLELRGSSVIADNHAREAYLLAGQDAIALHAQKVDKTVIWSNGFDHVFNNLDVAYTDGTTVENQTLHTVTVVEHYLDNAQPDRLTQYRAGDGETLTLPYEILDNYKIYSAGMRAAAVPTMSVDEEGGTVTVYNIDRDLTVTLNFYRTGYVVTIMEHYLDGSREDVQTIYQVEAGGVFSERYTIPDGYHLGSFGSDPLGVVVGIAEQSLMYDNVNQNVEVYLNWAPQDNAGEQTIVLSGDIIVDTAIDISSGRVTYTSDADGPYTIFRGEGFTGNLFEVSGDGTLVLENIVVDGRKDAVEGTTGSLVSINGGEVCLQEGAVLKNAYSSEEGAAVRVLANGVLTMENGSVVTQNTSRTGAGVYVNRGGTFNMNGGKITDNPATVSPLGYGGGVYVDFGGTFHMTEGEISRNSAFCGGGVVVIGTFVMEGGKISENDADYTNLLGTGGGVYVYGTFEMTGGEISGNAAADQGGGVYVGEGAILISGVDVPRMFIMSGGVISNNTAKYGAGVQLMNEASFILQDGEIQENKATYGGGIYIYTDSELTVTGGMVSGNTASYGGGIYAVRCLIDMEDGSVSGNTATARGGGIYLQEAVLDMKSGNISRNYGNYAGGIYAIEGSTITMENGEISGNSSYNNGGAIHLRASAFTMRNGEITANYTQYGDGAGISIGDNSTYVMQGGKISDNHARAGGGGIFMDHGTFTMEDGIITGNSCGIGGGSGVHLVNVNHAIFTMKGGEISNNIGNTSLSPNAFGGGVYAGGTFVMEGGIITNNKAPRGGGVYVTQVFVMKGGSISGNTADYGGGIYVRNGGSFTSEGGEVSGNMSAIEGDDLYLA